MVVGWLLYKRPMARHKHKPKIPEPPLVTFYMGDPVDAFCEHAHYSSVLDAFLTIQWSFSKPMPVSNRKYLFIYRDLDLVAIYHWEDTYLRWRRTPHHGSVQSFAEEFEYWARKIWGQL